ncbi:membrane hypothetical protein [Candidatus Sulfopaludibacter sp. SbA3]|nr:membrane hypothetical protein [Candidatus Sulfopaludibacter sp. SbA3]
MLVYPALWLNSLLSKDGTFDLRCIGVVHGALFLAAVWLFAPLLGDERRWARWTMYALVLFVYCDMMYVNSLNAFYMDEPAYLFLLLTVVFYLRMLRWRRRLDALMLVVCAFLLVSAKAQHALLGFWIAFLFFTAAGKFSPLRRKWWYAAGAALMAASLLMTWKARPEDYTAYSLYNVTFEEILPHAKNVDRTLADLGLDDSYRFCIGMKAYLPNSGMDDAAFRQRFMQRLSFGKLAIYYARHPAVAYQTMSDALSESGRQHAFGNFDMSTGYPPSTESRAFAAWSDVKRHFFYHHGAGFLFAFLALTAVFCLLLGLQAKRLPQGAWLGGLCLVGASFMEMATSTLCDSMDITRHSMIFFALFDMTVLGCAYLTIHGVSFALGKLPRFRDPDK